MTIQQVVLRSIGHSISSFNRTGQYLMKTLLAAMLLFSTMVHASDVRRCSYVHTVKVGDQFVEDPIQEGAIVADNDDHFSVRVADINVDSPKLRELVDGNDVMLVGHKPPYSFIKQYSKGTYLYSVIHMATKDGYNIYCFKK